MFIVIDPLTWAQEPFLHVLSLDVHPFPKLFPFLYSLLLTHLSVGSPCYVTCQLLIVPSCQEMGTSHLDPGPSLMVLLSGKKVKAPLFSRTFPSFPHFLWVM